MGVYIPPSNDSGSSDKGGGKNGVFGDKGKVVFYSRPSVGLKIWGPLVPASDYLPGLYTLTALQMLIGFTMIKNVRNIWHVRTPFARASKFLSTVGSGYLIFNSGLEVSRLTLPYDPWYEEAKQARLQAQQEGKKVNFWFGPWDLKPMSFQEWNKKVDIWILKTESDYENEMNEEGEKTIDFTNASPILHSAYLDAKKANQQRNSEILQLLENKNSFKDILPNYQTFSNFPIEKQHLVIPKDNHLEDDFDVDEIWELNNPWENLAIETSHMVRFIPKFRWIEEKANKETTKDLH